MLNVYRTRRTWAITKLGGKCICGSIDQLEIDHIDRTQKSIEISRLYSVSKERYEKEIIKCQLLCKDCHIKKTILERGLKIARGTHGTISGYRYCGPPKCGDCKKAKRECHSKWRKTKQV
jgi:hypothetical protein